MKVKRKKGRERRAWGSEKVVPTMGTQSIFPVFSWRANVFII